MASGSQKPSRSYSTGDVVLSYEPWIWSFAGRDEYARYCAYCFTEREGLKICAGCKLHRYCDASCQATDWKKEHKLECDMLKGVHAATVILDTVAGDSDHNAWLSVILVSKIAWKIKMNVIDELDGLGRIPARDVMASLPAYPKTGRIHNFLEYNMFKKVPADVLFPGFNPFPSHLHFMNYLRLIQHNDLPILDPRTKEIPIGTALIPQASHRAMTAVCWDSNVVLDFRGRNFIVHATEDIPQYSRLSDLRYSEMITNPFFRTRVERRRIFQDIYNRPCECRKCTPEYEAEINPLKCTTPGCSERLPSDNRSLLPCTQCGAISPNRLKQCKSFLDKLENIRKRAKQCLRRNEQVREQDEYPELLKEMDAADILHTDAHLRFLVGWDWATDLRIAGRHEEAWKLLKELVPCLRALLPKYQISRACFLVKAGYCPVMYLRTVPTMDRKTFTGEKTRQTVTDMMNDSPIWYDYCKESWEIYVKVYGKDSKWARQAEELLTSIKRCVAEVRRITATVPFDY